VKIKREKTRTERNFQIFLFLVLSFLIIFLVISNLRIQSKRSELKKEIEKLKAQVQALEERNQSLKKIISHTKDENYWEEKAREEGYLKEGEEMIVIKEVEKEKEKEIKETIWEKIKDIFQR
jgi:cell division protein FtsB